MGPHRAYNEPRNHKHVNSFVFAAHYNKKRGRCCVVVGRLCQSVAGRGLVSGSRRNEVPKGGWSEAELWRSLPTTLCLPIECKKPTLLGRLLLFVYEYVITQPFRLNRERLQSCGCKASSCCHVQDRGTYVGRTLLAW